jgi:hypothetical protein
MLARVLSLFRPVACSALALTLLATPALADDQTCMEAAARGQQLRKNLALRAARDAFQQCAALQCPKMVQTDCNNWQSEVTQSIPSVSVRTVDANGTDLLGTKVYLDGALWTDSNDGRAMEVDPGLHTFRYETMKHGTLERSIVIAEGEKLRVLRVQFGGPAIANTTPTPNRVATPSAPLASSSAGSTQRIVGYVIGIGGVTLLSLGAVAQFGYAIRQDNKAKALEPFANGGTDAAGRPLFSGGYDATEVGPECPLGCTQAAYRASYDGYKSTAKTAQIAAIGLGLGGAALLVGSVFLVLTAPSDTKNAARTPSALSLWPIFSGNAVGLGGTFE